MSFSAARSVSTMGTRMLRCSTTLLSKGSVVAGSLSAQKHGFSRGFMSMCRSRVLTPGTMTQQMGLTRMTSRGIQTTGDQEIAEFLKEEIKLETQSEKATLPAVQGFEMSQTDGAEAVFTRKLDNEVVTVKFNVNNTVDDDSYLDEDPNTANTADSQMVSKPPFVVDICKAGEATMSIQCVFPPTDDVPPPTEDQQEQYKDLIEIQDVSFLKKSDKWEEKVYCVSGSIMDGNLYDMLLQMLEDRGITGDFVDQLVQFATSFEHKKYVGFLEELKSFVEMK